jgi:hypothetical protein
MGPTIVPAARGLKTARGLSSGGVFYGAVSRGLVVMV